MVVHIGRCALRFHIPGFFPFTWAASTDRGQQCIEDIENIGHGAFGAGRDRQRPVRGAGMDGLPQGASIPRAQRSSLRDTSYHQRFVGFGAITQDSRTFPLSATTLQGYLTAWWPWDLEEETFHRKEMMMPLETGLLAMEEPARWFGRAFYGCASSVLGRRPSDPKRLI